MKDKWLQSLLLPTNSLLGRFAVASFFILPLFITLCGALLVNSFKHSQLNAEQETLQAQLYLILSQTIVENQQAKLPPALTEPRFNQSGSGLYGFVFDTQGKELWRSLSASLITQSFFQAEENFKTDNKHFWQIDLNKLEAVNVFSHDIEWVDSRNLSTGLRFIIASDNTPLRAELKSYQKRTWQWLGLMTLLLILAQIAILRWGLKPLQKLSNQLNQLQSNTIQQLDSNYPKEINPVIDNFNSILSFEKQQRQRYKNTLSDLAHSLKTPLAVIQSQLDDTSLANKTVQDQIDRIGQIIDHQLKRAVIHVNQNTLQNLSDKTPLKKLVDRLINTLKKVYREKNILFTNLIDDDVTVAIEESDLLEALGNILENACKYGKDSVTISASENEDEITILISDNGPGIPKKQQTTLLARGARGDTAHTGQGIGLSVSLDIISGYGGGLQVENNLRPPHLNGACFSITLTK